MIASHDPCTSDHIAMSVGDGQDIRSFGFLAPLIGHRLSPFLGNRVTAIEIDLFKIQISFNRHNALLPDPFQTSVSAPLAGVVIDGLPTDFLFVGSVGSGSIGI